MKPKSTPSGAPSQLYLLPQTGMPVIYPSRSKEIIYDTLQLSPSFVKNPFGPQLLILSRPNHRW
jgi:hypothetical protein